MGRLVSTLANRGTGEQITSALAIQHRSAPNTPPLNTEPLSHIITDAYRYENSSRLNKSIIRFVPKKALKNQIADWYIIEATETGELIGLTDIPYRLGIDPRSYLEPSASSITADPYCPQGFTYTFAMEAKKRLRAIKFLIFITNTPPILAMNYLA